MGEILSTHKSISSWVWQTEIISGKTESTLKSVFPVCHPQEHFFQISRSIGSIGRGPGATQGPVVAKPECNPQLEIVTQPSSYSHVSSPAGYTCLATNKPTCSSMSNTGVSFGLWDIRVPQWKTLSLSTLRPGVHQAMWHALDSRWVWCLSL